MSCGEGDHRRSECRFRNFTCHSCGKHGHISRACKSSNGVHQLEHTSPEGTPDSFTASMYKVGPNKEVIMIPVEIQGPIKSNQNTAQLARDLKGELMIPIHTRLE